MNTSFDATRHEDVLRVVKQVRARYRTRVALKGLAIVLGSGLLAFVISVWGLERLRFTPQSVIAFRTLVWLSVAVLTGRYLVWPLMRRVSDEQAALYLEEHEPTLESSIVSAVEAGNEARTRGAASAAMVEKLVEQALQRAREVEYGRRIEQQDMYRASGALAAIVVTGVLFMLFGPVQFRHGAMALLNPVSDAAAVNPYSVEISPGDVTIARGSDQRVLADLRGFESGEAHIFARGESRESFDRISMLPGPDGGFEVLLLALDEPTEYFVESEGIRSSTFTIDVADLPYVDQLQLEYVFPSYTGLSPRVVEDGGDIAALAGTEVHVRVTPTMLTPGGQLIVDGEPVALQDAGDGTWTGSLTVTERGFYEVELARADGVMVAASPQYTIDVLSDQPPSVSFTKPGRDFQATPVEEVFLEAVADDDYGIAELTLFYSVNGTEEQSVGLLSSGSRALAEVSGTHTLYLEEWDVEAGDIVSYYAVARDNRPGGTGREVTSDIYFIQVRPFRIDFREAQQAAPPPGAQAGQQQREEALSRLQREVIAATFNLERDREFYSDDDYSEAVVSVQLAQGRVREQVQALYERMVNRGITQAEEQFQRIAEMLPEAMEEMVTAEEMLGEQRTKDALSPEQRALLRLQKAEETYERYVSTSAQQQGGGAGSGANADDLADLFELELDKLKNQYETVQRGERQEQSQQLDETMERLKELARRQQQEAERARRRAAQNQGGGSGGAQSQRELAEETEEAARQLERLARETNDRELQEVARQLQEAVDAMRRSAASGGSQGMAEAGSALDRLDEAQRRLKRDQQDRLEEDIQNAQQRADELARTQAQIERDMQRLDEVAEPGELARRLMEQKESMWREVGQLRSDLEGLSQDSRADQRDASDRLREAANSIRDNKLEERVRYSRGLIGARDEEYIGEFEAETTRAIEDLQGRLRQAEGAVGETAEDRQAEALDQARDLVRGIESSQRRLEERMGQGQQGENQEGQGQEGEGQQGQGQQGEGQEGEGQQEQGQQGEGQEGEGQQGQGQQNAGTRGGDADGEARPGTRNDGSQQGGAGAYNGRLSDDDIRQFRREFSERRRETEDLRRALEAEGIDAAELDAVVSALRSLDSERTYDDPDEVARLQAQVLEGLKQLEFGLRRELEGDRDRAAIAGSDDVPDGFRRLVDEYYKALSRTGGGGG